MFAGFEVVGNNNGQTEVLFLSFSFLSFSFSFFSFSFLLSLSFSLSLLLFFFLFFFSFYTSYSDRRKCLRDLKWWEITTDKPKSCFSLFLFFPSLFPFFSFLFSSLSLSLSLSCFSFFFFSFLFTPLIQIGGNVCGI